MKKNVFLFIATLFLLVGCKTQDPAVIAQQEAEQQILYQNAIAGLKNHDFVLEADRINFKYGQSIFVNPSVNFVSLEKDRATVQIAFSTHRSGPNGIGGITVDGRVSNLKTNIDDKGNVTFSMDVIGNGISAQVFFNMRAGSNYCTATVSPNFNSFRTTFTGYLYPKEESNVFKGKSL